MNLNAILVAVFLLILTGDVYSKGDTLWLADFEKEPHPEGWKIEGYAFGTRSPGPLPYHAAVADLNQRQMMSGMMTSSAFLIAKKYLVLEMAGSFNPGRCYVDILVDGETICRVAPKSTERWKADPASEWCAVDMSAYLGKQAELHFVDNYNYGWITLNRIFQCDHTDIEKAPYKNIRLNPLPGNNPLIKNPNPKKDNTVDLPRQVPKRLVKLDARIPKWEKIVVDKSIHGQNLLLAVAKDAHIQEVVVSIEGQEKLRIPLPLSFEECADLIPVYDLSNFQGQALAIAFCHPAVEDPRKAIVMGDIPARSPGFPRSFHIRCRVGRLNDPNGLVYHEGVYHLFHQYSYEVRGKMWAHYTSTDLVHWEERPVALFPDKFGSIHSGSGVVDHQNTAGFQVGNKPPIVLAYSASAVFNPQRTKVQCQGLAFSNDGGLTFQKYDGNPVHGNWIDTEMVAGHERDPKVIWYSPTKLMDPMAEDGYWVMALFEGEGVNPNGSGVQLYTSSDLKNWTKGSFTDNFHECPEFFPLALDSDPRNIYWIMYGAKGDYLIGEFDGHSFTPINEKKIVYPAGGKWYAAQSFSNLPGNPPRRVQLSWAREILSTPIEATLRTTPLGMRMCSQPIRELESLRTVSQNLDGFRLSPGAVNPLAGFKNALGDIELEIPLQDGLDLELTVRGRRIAYDSTSRTLSLDGESGSKTKLPAEMKSLILRVLFDDDAVDVFVGEHGLFYVSTFSDRNDDASPELGVKGGTVTFERLRIHKLKSIW